MSEEESNDPEEREEAEDRWFDRQEAERHLPQLGILLGDALEKKKQVEEIDREMSQVQNRILLYGGLLPPQVYLAEKKRERENLAAAIRQTVTEVERAGCVVKDLDLGLVDFPSILDDEQVYLCWKLGEERILYWHRMDEGFAGRKPLDPLISGENQKAQP
jgi:hypothetical protein